MKDGVDSVGERPSPWVVDLRMVTLHLSGVATRAARGEGGPPMQGARGRWGVSRFAEGSAVRVAAVLLVGLFSAAVITVASAPTAGAAYGPSYCSGYRWDVKTGQDPQASQVNLGSVTPTTVGYMTSLPAQPSLPDDQRLAPWELTQYEITATIVDISVEHDNDYHVVIQDNSSSNVMITEVPDPACVPSSSPFAAMIANARAELQANGRVGATVAIKGIGFFDSNT